MSAATIAELQRLSAIDCAAVSRLERHNARARLLDALLPRLDGILARVANFEWKPIDTAPRDDRCILVCCGEVQNVICASTLSRDVGLSWSHWMPLPPLPAPPK